MSDTDTAAAVSAILAEELAVVTDAMIEAASIEMTRISVTQVSDPQRPGRMIVMPAPITEAQRLTAVWRAMLRAKLGSAK